MIRSILIAATIFVVSSPSFAKTKCFTEKEINRLAKSHGLKKYGEMALGNVDDRGNADAWDNAYVNYEKHKFLSVKNKGQCFFDPTFLSEESYDERFQFEGDEECDGC